MSEPVTVCVCCEKRRFARDIETDGACIYCHVTGVDDPAVGTEFDLDTETALSWRRAVEALDARPVNDRSAVTASLRVAGAR